MIQPIPSERNRKWRLFTILLISMRLDGEEWFSYRLPPADRAPARLPESFPLSEFKTAPFAYRRFNNEPAPFSPGKGPAYMLQMAVCISFRDAHLRRYLLCRELSPLQHRNNLLSDGLLSAPWRLWLSDPLLHWHGLIGSRNRKTSMERPSQLPWTNTRPAL